MPFKAFWLAVESGWRVIAAHCRAKHLSDAQLRTCMGVMRATCISPAAHGACAAISAASAARRVPRPVATRASQRAVSRFTVPALWPPGAPLCTSPCSLPRLPPRGRCPLLVPLPFAGPSRVESGSASLPTLAATGGATALPAAAASGLGGSLAGAAVHFAGAVVRCARASAPAAAAGGCGRACSSSATAHSAQTSLPNSRLRFMSAGVLHIAQHS